MDAWRIARRTKSSGELKGFFAGLFPIERRQFIEQIMIGHCGQASQ